VGDRHTEQGHTAELVAVVNQTIQPTLVSLWLRPPAPRQASATGLNRANVT
jgi:hypothetical protein